MNSSSFVYSDSSLLLYRLYHVFYRAIIVSPKWMQKRGLIDVTWNGSEHASNFFWKIWEFAVGKLEKSGTIIFYEKWKPCCYSHI